MTAHYVYRCFDAADRLLYIGCSKDPATRVPGHKYEGGHWFPRLARVEVEAHIDRDAALVAERLAIRSERPLFNVQHSDRLARRYRTSRLEAAA